MKTNEVKYLLQQYFNGESTTEDERKLESYFCSGNIDSELKEYQEFFSGLSMMQEVEGEETIEDDILKHIDAYENRQKTKTLGMWKWVTGIAASIILVIGSYLIYEQQQQPYQDTFDNPQMAYAQAKEALTYMSAKYNQGLAELSHFQKLESATEPLIKGVKPVNDALNKLEPFETTNN